MFRAEGELLVAGPVAGASLGLEIVKQTRDVCGGERELDLADEEAGSVFAVACHDVDLGAAVGGGEVSAPGGVGLDVEVASFEKRAVGIDAAAPAAEEGVGDAVASALAAAGIMALAARAAERGIGPTLTGLSRPSRRCAMPAW